MSRRGAVASGLQQMGIALGSLGVGARVLTHYTKPPGAKGPGDGWLHMLLAGGVCFAVGLFMESSDAPDAGSIRGGGLLHRNRPVEPLPAVKPRPGPDLRPVSDRAPTTLQGYARRVP